jgi:hypothetical protein
MRELLSERPSSVHTPGAVGALIGAAALSAVPAAAAVLDQTGGRSLADHAEALYAPYGTEPDPALLYGLVYAVALVGLVLWLPVIRAVRSGRRSATALATVVAVVTVVTAALAVLLLSATEYGGLIFPPVWGILALLPPAAGVIAVVLLLRRRRL